MAQPERSDSPSAGELKARALADLSGIAERQQARGIREYDHTDADSILLVLIGDEDVRKAYDRIEKWYA